MKRLIIKSILAATLIFSITSCDDRLDREQELTTGGSVDYTTSEGALATLIGAYQSFYNMGWEQIPLIAVRGDDVNAGGIGDQPGFNDTDHFIYDPTYFMYNSLWQTWYQKVLVFTSQINELEKFKANGVSANLIDQYIAEAKVMRAFTIFQLSRVWGRVIIMQSLDETQLRMRDKEDVMNWVSAQMDEAIPLLPNVRPNERTDLKGGITKHFALATKALANLELKNYQAVADATGEIIKSGKYSLYPDFYQLFKIPGKLSNESLAEVQYSDFGQGSGTAINHTWAFYGPQSWTPAVAGIGAGWGFFEPSQKYIKFMIDRGEKVRLETTVLFTNRGIQDLKTDPNYATLPAWISNTTRDGDVINDNVRSEFSSGKFYVPSKQITPGRTGYGNNNNYRIMRYAEILLMYAEAVTRGATGSAGTADQAVNLIRQRAGLANLSNVTSDQVMDEKYAELATEWGSRYYDLQRLGKTGELSYDGRNYSPDKEFLPYPTAQLQRIQQIEAFGQE